MKVGREEVDLLATLELAEPSHFRLPEFAESSRQRRRCWADEAQLERILSTVGGNDAMDNSVGNETAVAVDLTVEG